MSSSISNSEVVQSEIATAEIGKKKPSGSGFVAATYQTKRRTRIGLRILLFVLLVFVLLEAFTRFKLFKMSKDFVRFSTYSQRAKTLANAKGVSVALLGNSSTEKGVSLPIFLENSQQNLKKPIFADIFTADASKINTWQYMLNTYFWRPEVKPDLLILTFYSPNLQDGNDIEIGRLAQFFTQPSDWQELFQTDLPTASQRIDLVLSSFWATYAARDRIKERVLTLAIPRYVDYTEAKNTVIYQHNLKKQKQQPTSQPTYVALQRLLDNARENEMKICFVAFPTQPIKNATSYELDSKMIKLIEQAGMYFVDMHRFPELTEKFYADEIHLTPKGAEIYTRHFVEKMTPILKKIKN